MGLRVIDHLVQAPTGEIVAVEVKSGGAVRTGLQTLKDAAIEAGLGTFVGKNAPANLRGTSQPIPTIIRH
jgi:hypothetical protein